MTQPLATSAFVNSIGVNTDLDFFNTPYVNAAAVADDIKYLGITHVRDILPAADAAALAPYAALANEGIKFDLIVGVGGFGLPASMATVKAELDAFEAKYPGAIASVEGPNEPNIYPFSYAGLTGTAAAVAYQAALYKLVAADPALHGVTVDNFAFGGVGAGTYAQAGNQSASANAGNIHIYPDGEGSGAPQPTIANGLALAAVSTPGMPMVMTEFGYSSYAGGDIPQAAQAAYELDGLLDASRDGISQTYLYELLDGDTGTSGYEDNFGQFDSDALTPKAAAVALHNLTTILADPGTGLPAGRLNYSIAGLTAPGGNSLLMEKSSGAFDLAIWDEPAAASLATAHDAITVSLGATYATVEVFDPTASTSAISVAHDVSAVALDITGHPLIVEVEPGLAPNVTPLLVPATPVHIAATQATATISASNTTVTSAGGTHTITLAGTGDTLTAGAGNDTIHFGSFSTIDAGGGTNTLYDTGHGSTIVLPAAGKGLDLIHGNVFTNGDTFDLRAMLQPTTWSGVTNNDLGNWVHIRVAAGGADAIVSVAPTGSFNEGSSDVAHFYGSGSVSLATLLAHSVTT